MPTQKPQLRHIYSVIEPELQHPVENMDAELSEKRSLSTRLRTASTGSPVLWSKISPIVTFPAAIIAFSLGLVAFLSGGQNSLSEYDVMTLNTSTLLQNTIKIEPNTTTTKRSEVVEVRYIEENGKLIPHLQDRQLPTLSLPGTSEIGSFFSSVGSELASATSDIGALSTGTTGSALLNSLESIASDIVGEVAAAAGDEIVSITNALIKDVVDAVGIAEWYSIYSTEYCSGNWTPSYDFPGATKNVTKCTQFTNVSVGTPSNSTVKLGTTTVDYSALNISNKLATGSGQLHSILVLLKVLNIMGLVASALLIPLVPLLILPFLRVWWYRLILTFLASLASLCFSIISLVNTAIHIVLKAVVNGAADGLGVECLGGNKVMPFFWVASTFMTISSATWWIMWFKDAYVRRKNIENQMAGRPLVRTAESNFPQNSSSELTGRIGVRQSRVGMI